tara:strand:+ start:441 stop:821 length:381 start_codon:yes stop_codon:yes gene_type:complete
MLAPIDHAWMLLKAGPTEREQRNANEGMEPFQAHMVDSRYPYNRGEEEEEDSMDTQTPPAMAPTAKPPIDEAMESLRGGGAPWQEEPTLGELADMDDPEEKEHHMREAGRRSAAPSDSPQRTLHDY